MSASVRGGWHLAGAAKLDRSFPRNDFVSYSFIATSPTQVTTSRMLGPLSSAGAGVAGTLEPPPMVGSLNLGILSRLLNLVALFACDAMLETVPKLPVTLGILLRLSDAALERLLKLSEDPLETLLKLKDPVETLLRLTDGAPDLILLPAV